MTELLTRPPAAAGGVTTEDTTSASLWWRGSLAAVWAVAVGVAILMVCVLIVWATDSRSGAGAGAALRLALQLWLAAHKVPLHVGAGSLAVPPLGLTLGLSFVVARAAAVLARGHRVQTLSGVLSVGVAVAVPYAVLAAFVAAAANSTPVRPSPLAALLAGLVVGWLAATWGAARGTGSVRGLTTGLPPSLATALPAAAVAAAALLVAGMLLTLGSLAVHARTAADLADGLGGGVIAHLALLVLDAMLLPNAAATAVGYLAGPGFAVGAGTSVSMGGAHVGAMPSLPLLAAVPHAGATAPVRVFAIVVLLAVGGLIGWRVARQDTDVWRAGGLAVLTAAITGVLAALAVAVAGGPAGAGRMGTVGASPWQVGLVLTAELGFVAALVAVALRWPSRRRNSR
jgi:hypothetical protein